MTRETGTKGELATVWNGPKGRAWVEAQELISTMFKPFEELLVDAVRAEAACRVLDVGCGSGDVTIALLRVRPRDGFCIGIDLSAAMIRAARARAASEQTPAHFIEADAATYAFEPASFDLILSRFGLMFFDEPVRAFANLRRAAKGGAALRFVAWRSAEENPIMTTAERAAAPLFSNLPVRPPGQFAFAEDALVRRMLEQSGWSRIEIQPIDVACSFPTRQLDDFITRLGPLEQLLRDESDVDRAEIVDRVRPAFAPFVEGQHVRFTAACWMVAARAPMEAPHG